ncbi:maleylpyruvate isomerase family mycothiol-dependent enzyme [Janibacter corallicola]|uniref:maleylpyruvate isomerase family mycothiol-dependent enzyme n=1 Tax=Janibacter corallicola TaxID=415212 RepID=UPI000830E3B3|nr:maleylpyruvate isomerase family mycothiol-dependent enzyme [Janibacter corallicola]
MPLPRDAASVFDRKNTPLMRLLDRADPQALTAASPCPGWSGVDVVEHLIESQRDFLLLAGADMPDPAPTVEQLGAAMAWRTHAEAVARQLADDGFAEHPHRRGEDGPSVGRVFEATFGLDLLIHRWDIARTLGGETTFSDRELDQIEEALTASGEHLRAKGMLAPPVAVAADASRQDRLVALTGRRP